MSDMSKKEASEWLMAIKDKYIFGGDEEFDRKRKLALDMGAEALKNPNTIHITFRDKNGIIYGGYYDKTRELIFTAYLTREFAEKIGVQIIEEE